MLNNKYFILICWSFLLVTSISFSQVGIGTTTPNSSLDIRSSSQATPANTDGILIPKVDTFSATNPNALQDGMLVYLTSNVTHNSILYTQGFHYWNNTTTRWIPITSIERINDLLDGKSDIDGSQDGSSVFLGVNAGANDDSSDNKNVAVGFEALQDINGSTNNEGDNNVAIGYRSLTENTIGRRNTAVGHTAMTLNTTGKNNTALGGQALNSNTEGDSNVALGAFTLAKNTTGKNNVSAGNQSMRYNVTGEGNTALGDYSLKGDLDDTSPVAGSGNFNVAIGSQALEGLESGHNNIAIGYRAGNSMVSNNGSVFIGYEAGFNETNADRLYIENSNAGQSSALIYGDFSTNKVRINDFLGIGKEAVTNALEVNGSASKSTSGAFIANSDRRLKKNIVSINGQTALETLEKLRGVTYEWNDTSTKMKRPEGVQYGFIAQELMTVFPEKVSKDSLGFYQTAYGDYDAFFVEAIKELNDKIKLLELENLKLKIAENKLNKIESRLQILEKNKN